MSNALVTEERRRDLAGSVSRVSGMRPQGLVMSVTRTAAIQIANSSRLPVTSDLVKLQRADGLFYFIVGFSATGGPDVPGP